VEVELYLQSFLNSALDGMQCDKQSNCHTWARSLIVAIDMKLALHSSGGKGKTDRPTLFFIDSTIPSVINI
jgi:hypothetical protein